MTIIFAYIIILAPEQLESRGKAMRRASRNDMLHSVEEKVKEIDYDFSHFTIQEFAQWVAAKRGVNISLEACDDLTMPVGFWFLSDDGAHVMYSSPLGPMLETITILHELMHIFLGHKTKYIPTSFPFGKYLQGIAARNMAEQSAEDQEAEIGAFLVYQQYVHEADRATDLMSDVFGEEKR